MFPHWVYHGLYCIGIGKHHLLEPQHDPASNCLTTEKNLGQPVSDFFLTLIHWIQRVMTAITRLNMWQLVPKLKFSRFNYFDFTMFSPHWHRASSFRFVYIIILLWFVLPRVCATVCIVFIYTQCLYNVTLWVVSVEIESVTFRDSTGVSISFVQICAIEKKIHFQHFQTI